MKKKRKSGGASWMDTYGDMVTLLLCFFVLLYSMSTVDQEKWAVVVQSFQRETASETMGTPGQGTGLEYNLSDSAIKPEEITEEQVAEALRKKKKKVEEYTAQNNMKQQISISQGAGYVFITFQDTVFFEGDSYELLDSGKEILDVVAAAIKPQGGLIDELRIMGHTSQGSADKANNPETDRFLSSNRAATVTVYLQEKNIVDPDRLVSVGYGQWRPIAGFDTSDERAKNRRVELMITGINPNSMESSVDQYFTAREGDAKAEE